ncbi:MAG: flagellar hook-associated protein FlgK [Methylophagaceae bacterium]
MSLLNIGTTALLTTQNALATTSHNISNVNTEGYSRQRTEQVTHLPNFEGTHYIGSGVTVGSVERIYDTFLAEQVRRYTSQESQFDTFYEFASQIDDILGSTELGLDSGLESFFAAAQEVANDPTSIPARQVLLTEAGLLANRFNTLDGQLQQFDDQIDSQITVSIGDINSLSRGIAELNQAIIEAEGTGATPNDLLDKRDNLINQLSEYVSVDIIPESSGAVSVFVGSGQALVVGTTQIDLFAIPDGGLPPRITVGYGPAQIDISTQLTGGTIGGIFQVRTDVLDASRTALDDLASSFVTAINNLHNDALNPAGAIDLNGNAGGDLFDPAGLTASTINILITDPRLIAASSGTSPGVGNNENILVLADLQTDPTTVVVSAAPLITQSFSDTIGVLIAEVATRTHQADIGRQTQQGLRLQAESKFDSVSGVNLDEEAANLIRLQQAYQAASQIIVTSNTIFNALINAV